MSSRTDMKKYLSRQVKNNHIILQTDWDKFCPVTSSKLILYLILLKFANICIVEKELQHTETLQTMHATNMLIYKLN